MLAVLDQPVRRLVVVARPVACPATHSSRSRLSSSAVRRYSTSWYSHRDAATWELRAAVSVVTTATHAAMSPARQVEAVAASSTPTTASPSSSGGPARAAGPAGRPALVPADLRDDPAVDVRREVGDRRYVARHRQDACGVDQEVGGRVLHPAGPLGQQRLPVRSAVRRHPGQEPVALGLELLGDRPGPGPAAHRVTPQTAAHDGTRPTVIPAESASTFRRRC